MNLAANRSQLMHLGRDIALKWAETRQQWKDEKAREFERKYMSELDAQVDKAAAVIEKLDVILTKARRDCE